MLENFHPLEALHSSATSASQSFYYMPQYFFLFFISIQFVGTVFFLVNEDIHSMRDENGWSIFWIFIVFIDNPVQ